MKKLLSFLLSSIILMGSSVVTLAETSVDTEITNSNDNIEIKPNIYMNPNSLNSSGSDNTSVEIKSSDKNGYFDFVIPENALVYSWDKSKLKKSITLSSNVGNGIISSNLSFANKSDGQRKIKLEFSIPGVLLTQNDNEIEVIQIKQSGTKINGIGNIYNSSTNMKVQSFELNLPEGNSIEERTVTLSVNLNLNYINFNNITSGTNISDIISGIQTDPITKPIFTLTISLVPETASGS